MRTWLDASPSAILRAKLEGSLKLKSVNKRSTLRTFQSEEGTTCTVLRTLTLKLWPESGLDCPVCADFPRQRKWDGDRSDGRAPGEAGSAIASKVLINQLHLGDDDYNTISRCT